jgi:uncharacterized lipoprotein YddW (UPF0748 family)
VVSPLSWSELQGQTNLLKIILAAAHAEGLEVHPLTVLWYKAPKNTDPDRLVHTVSGETTNTLCPSVAGNRDLMRRMLLELATDFDIDGIHYDYVRFPDGGYCYCRHCRAGFEKVIKAPVTAWPKDVLYGGKFEKRYQEYLYGVISSFVREMYPLLKQLKPQLVVSAAVWAKESGSRVPGVWQDWGEWARSGWVDFLSFMNYSLYILQHYDEFARNEAKQIVGKRSLVYALGSVVDSPEGLVNAVRLGRELKGDGFIIYTLTTSTYSEHLPELHRTVWSVPATVPRFGRNKGDMSLQSGK